MAGVIYCLCRIIIVGLIEVNFGGQIDSKVEFNVKFSESLYEYTRSYINIDGMYVKNLIWVTRKLNETSLLVVLIFWLRILYDHLCFYMVLMHEIYESTQLVY